MRRVAYAVPCILLVAMRLFNALFAFLSLCFLSFYELDLARCRLVRRHVLLFIGAFFVRGGSAVPKFSPASCCQPSILVGMADHRLTYRRVDLSVLLIDFVLLLLSAAKS